MPVMRTGSCMRRRCSSSVDPCSPVAVYGGPRSERWPQPLRPFRVGYHRRSNTHCPQRNNTSYPASDIQYYFASRPNDSPLLAFPFPGLFPIPDEQKFNNFCYATLLDGIMQGKPRTSLYTMHATLILGPTVPARHAGYWIGFSRVSSTLAFGKGDIAGAKMI